MAASAGHIPVIKALLDEGSDVMAKDLIGSTVLSLLAKGGHLWALYYVFIWIKYVLFYS